MSFREIELKEEDADIKISDWIRENYKSKKFFRDRAHLNNELIWEYTKRVLNKLGYPAKKINNIEEIDIVSKSGFYGGTWNEVPIYPSVVKILGLNMIDESTKYCMVRAEKRIDYFTFKEYMYNYINYIKCTLDIEKYW